MAITEAEVFSPHDHMLRSRKETPPQTQKRTAWPPRGLPSHIAAMNRMNRHQSSLLDS
jgi:hypothetical protein